MLRLLARYIVVVILGGSLAGLGAHSAISKNLQAELNRLQVSAQQASTQTVQPTDTSTPTATATPTIAPSGTAMPTATAVVTQCSTGEDNDNSVEEQHESAQAQKHEHEMSNRKASDEKCEVSGKDKDKSSESNEGANEGNNEGTQVENQNNSVQSSQPVIIFVQLGKNLSTELQNLLRSLSIGSGR